MISEPYVVRRKRSVGLPLVTMLVIIGIVVGAISGAIVGAVTVVATGNTNSGNATTAIANLSQTSDVKVPVTSAVAVVKDVGPAVVTIVHTIAPTVGPYGQEEPGGTALGSGFFVDTKGDIVTNAHVVTGATSFSVVYSTGKKTTGTLVGMDAVDDVAVVHVNGAVPAVAHFGNSSQLQPGQPVIAIGNALGEFQNTVTEGIVSGLNRRLSAEYPNMIQTDAAINHGNSGGPLLNLAGQVIGINTAIDRSTGESSNNLFGYSDPNATVAEGLGFAIPSNTVGEIAERLINHIPGAYLGVEFTSVSSVAQENYGVPAGAFIKSVVAGSPADKAGIKVHDVIVSVDGERVTSNAPLEDLIAPHKPGDKVTLKIWRAGNTLTVTATLGKKPNS
jgi:2-alkenal reductase